MSLVIQTQPRQYNRGEHSHLKGINSLGMTMRTNADKHKCHYFNHCFETLFWFNALTIEKCIKLKIFKCCML